MTHQSVAITGATGFVGMNLVPYLQDKGVKIFSIIRDGIEAGESQVSFAGFNPQYINSKAITIIIHMAGKAHDMGSGVNDVGYADINEGLTQKVYNAFMTSPASLFIYISSVKAVIDKPDEIVTEDTIPDPQTPYGRSKLAAESYITSIALPEGKRYIILRPCMIHGPGNKGNLNLLYEIISKRIPYPLGTFENKRSFLSIGNFCFVIKELLHNKSIPTGIYNIADSEPLSTNELIIEIGKAIGKRPVILKWNASFMKCIARIGDTVHLPFNSNRLQKLTESYIVSNKKFLKAIEKPMPVSALEGIRLTLRSFSGSH